MIDTYCYNYICVFTLLNKMICHVDNNAGHSKEGSATPELKPRLRVERAKSSPRARPFLLKHSPWQIKRPNRFSLRTGWENLYQYDVLFPVTSMRSWVCK